MVPAQPLGRLPGLPPPQSILSYLDTSAGVILGFCRQRVRLPTRRTLLNESHSFRIPALAPSLEYSRRSVLLSGRQNELTGPTLAHRHAHLVVVDLPGSTCLHFLCLHRPPLHAMAL